MQRKSIGVNSEGDSNENAAKSARHSSSNGRVENKPSPEIVDLTVSCKPYRILKRTRPLPWKSQDPSQCYDILDEMYTNYYDQEVRPMLFEPACFRSHLITFTYAHLRIALLPSPT